MAMGKIARHNDLAVYQRAMEAAMVIFEASKSFPKEETCSLTDPIRRSSRSVCANLAEAWRKRRSKGAFINKLSEVEAEAAGTEVWIEFATGCAYLTREQADSLYRAYKAIVRTVVGMINHPETWIIGDGA
jgi:four helix bundle protein